MKHETWQLGVVFSPHNYVGLPASSWHVNIVGGLY